MASGSSALVNPVSKGFDFGSDDILCSYEDYDNNKDSANGTLSDPAISFNSSKEFQKDRMARSAGFPMSYGQPGDSVNQEVVSIVERSVRRHTDNVMRFLEGISSRLSQLELYCYNLDKSIGEMRTELVHDHGEADSKLISVEKHLQEVHRSVQVLRDKQELADTQKELAKLQLARKDSSSSSHSRSNEEKSTPHACDTKKSDSPSEANNQLALALPHQVMPQHQPPPVPPPSQPAPQNVAQQQSYYFPPSQVAAPNQHQPAQYLTSEAQYRPPKIQDISRATPQPVQPQVSQIPPPQFPLYQQQWPQQLAQQVQPSQQSSMQQPPQQPPMQQPPQQLPMQPQIRPPTTVYPTYPPPSQPANPSPPEVLPNSMSMQVSYSAVPQPLSSCADTLPYGYGTIRPVPQQAPPQQVKGAYGGQPGECIPAGSLPALPPGTTYMMYDPEGRTHISHQPPPYSQGGYPQPPAGANVMSHNPIPSPFLRSHPYSELIEKFISMGFRGDHVASVMQRIEDSGQQVDFNAVLDRLSGHSSGGPQRGWSG